MAVHPPARRLWWKEPVEKVELTWITIAFLWGLVMFGTMVVWHFKGEQNLSNEAYRISPEVYEARSDAMVQKFKVREEGNTGVPVVHPPAGSDVYLVGRTFQWTPVLELEKGQSYRLHLSSLDYMHGFSLQPVNINVQVLPGYDMVMTVKPTEAGDFAIVCNEFCGIGHHTMTGKIHVVDKR